MIARNALLVVIINLVIFGIIELLSLSSPDVMTPGAGVGACGICGEYYFAGGVLGGDKEGIVVRGSATANWWMGS